MIEGRGNASLPIEIQISDNGPGVPDHIREHLFNPFISAKRDGQGLGLALVDTLVRDMNGLVQYSRDKENGRSIFRILLPMSLGSKWPPRDAYWWWLTIRRSAPSSAKGCGGVDKR